MTNAIEIGETIKNTITQNQDMVDEVGEKIYAVIAPLSATYPLLVYTRESITNGANTKDGFYGDYVTFRVDVLDKKYTPCCKLANKVRHLFEKRHIDGLGIELHDTRMAAIAESYDGDAYITQVRFTTFVTDKPEENSQNG